MADQHICVAIYPLHAQADEAFSHLEVAGFAMNLVSIAGRDHWSAMRGSYHAKGRFAYCGRFGPFWERLWANLPGWGVFCLFDDGPFVVAGSLARTIIEGLEDDDPSEPAGKSPYGFIKGLSGIGMPIESLVEYEKTVMNGSLLLFVSGSSRETDRAVKLLEETKAINHTLHHGLQSHAPLRRPPNGLAAVISLN